MELVEKVVDFLKLHKMFVFGFIVGFVVAKILTYEILLGLLM